MTTTETTSKHLGIIELSQSLLLKSLGFPKGSIHSVVWDIEHRSFRIVIEDEDMPEVRASDRIWAVQPSYIEYHGGSLLDHPDGVFRQRPDGTEVPAGLIHP